MFKLNVRKSILVNLAAVSSDDERIRPCSHTADHIVARDLRFLPLFCIVNLIRVRDFLNMKSVFFTALFLLLLFKSCQLGVLRSVLPIVDNIITCYDNMGLVHSNIFGLNCDVLIFNRATHSIAKNNNPLIWCLFSFRHKDTVFTACHDLLKTAHIFNMLFINGCIPEDNAHILTFWLLKGKD
jgi:hypothetical protein